MTMRNHRASLLLSSLGIVLILLYFPAPIFSFDQNNHGELVRRAYTVLVNDGKTEIVQMLEALTNQPRRPNVSFLQAIVNGTVGADEAVNFAPVSNNMFWRHGHNPNTHTGWRVACRRGRFQVTYTFASAAGEAERFFARAMDSWMKRALYDAGYWLGFSSHFVQDPSVPHHAAATPESATANRVIQALGCAGNGTHDLYEDWVRDNFNSMPFHATNGGTYDLGTGLAPHWQDTGVSANSAYAWSDQAAHEGFARYPEVDEVAEATCQNLPAITGNCQGVASQLVPSAERRTAGFVNFFFSSIGRTGFWHLIQRPSSISVLSPDINPTLVTLPDNGRLPTSNTPINWWYGVNAHGTFIDPVFNPSIQQPKNGGLSTMPNFGFVILSFDAQSISSPILTFETWWEIESVDAHAFDIMQILIEDAQGQRQLLKTLNPIQDVNGPPDVPYTSGGFGAPGRWVQHNINLQNIPTSGTVKVIFMFETRDALYNAFRGWFVRRVGIVDLPSAFTNPAGVVQDVQVWSIAPDSQGIEQPNATDRPWILEPRK